MKKQLKWPTILLLSLMSVCSLSAHGAENYGFSAGLWPCPLWSTFFPLSFQVPGDDGTEDLAKPVFNIIYIPDSKLKNMDDFYDIYNVQGNYVWPTNPWLIRNTKAVCQKDGDCVAKGYGQVGKGISAYNDIKNEFPGETVKVFSESVHSDGTGDITWFFLSTRKLKLLRVEYFTPYTGNIDSFRPYVEPLFFEYRATGNSDEMELKESGGTAYGANYNDVNLPQYIRLTRLSAMQIWLNTVWKNHNPWKSITPGAHTVSLTDSQKALIPANCQ